MSEQKPYENREIDQMFTEVHAKLDAILMQTQKTNGRVGSLENWKWFITGGLAIITVIILPVVFILLRNVL